MNISQEEIERRKKIFLWSPFLENIPPDHVNERGVKFWFDPSLTEWARTVQNGWSGPMPALPTAVVYVVESPTEKTRLLIIDGQVVDENPNYEAMATLIDKHKLARKFTPESQQ